MKTKFDIGDSVFIVGEVLKITIDKSDIIYTIWDESAHRIGEYSENDLMLKKKGQKSDGN